MFNKSGAKGSHFKTLPTIFQLNKSLFIFLLYYLEPFATPFREIKAKQNLLIMKGIYSGGLVKFDL